jgi:Flp pilus assembly protein TadG
MRQYLIIAAVVAVIVSFGYGYHTGHNAADTAHALQLAAAREDAVKAAELASRKEEERLAVEAQRAALAQQLEDQAYAESVSHPACLPASRVRRLNSF